MGSDTTITADATEDGDGGKVIVWADEVTRFYGNIKASGGAQSGDGGFVEVSGKQSLDMNGIIDVSAVYGEMGTILFDPNNITIQDTGGTQDGQLGDNEILFADNPPNYTISDDAIEALSGNIILQAETNISVDVDIDLTTQSIALMAGNDITLSNNNSIITTSGNIHLEADSPHATGGSDGNGTISYNFV